VSWLLVGLALAAETPSESVTADAWRLGYRDGSLAGQQERPLVPGVVSFGSAFGTAALGTALVGPCLAAPCVVVGAGLPGVIYGSTMPRTEQYEGESRRYRAGYRSGWRDNRGPGRVRPAVLGGVSGAVLGATAAYVTVGLVMSRQGYDPFGFPDL
jgi:hypothetical protein